MNPTLSLMSSPLSEDGSKVKYWAKTEAHAQTHRCSITTIRRPSWKIVFSRGKHRY